MDEKSKRRIKRYFDITSLVGENQATAVFIPYDHQFDDVQNQQRAEVMRARLCLLENVVGRLEARVSKGAHQDIYVARSPTGHDPYGRRPSVKGCDPENFKQSLLLLADDFAPCDFLLSVSRKPVERIHVSKSGDCASEALADSLALSGALVAWLEQFKEVSNVKVREFSKPSRSCMSRMVLSAIAKRDWRKTWEKSDA